jgi:putative transcriptional regulator
MGERETTRVRCHLDEVLRKRKMTLTQLAKLTDISLVNLSVLKNDRARAVRFSTLVALCDALECQPGELFTVVAATDG